MMVVKQVIDVVLSIQLRSFSDVLATWLAVALKSFLWNRLEIGRAHV